MNLTDLKKVGSDDVVSWWLQPMMNLCTVSGKWFCKLNFHRERQIGRKLCLCTLI